MTNKKQIEQLKNEIKELKGEITVLRLYIYHIQQVVGNNVMAIINDEWEKIGENDEN